ncbi:hypothetical protein TA3x_000449 [Tundrisphaera sp. TA3]|uniref:hypothetical protein n=1 Tax=Tundrisphaera sp. TA3 TaxID=3435775 RepID=UPI003EBDBC7F
MSDVLNLPFNTVDELEDFRFGNVSYDIAHGIIKHLSCETSGLTECLELRRFLASTMAVDETQNHANEMVDFISRRPGGACRSDLLRRFRRLNRAQLDLVLNSLIDKGLIEALEYDPATMSTGGRRPVVYRGVSPVPRS